MRCCPHVAFRLKWLFSATLASRCAACRNTGFGRHNFPAAAGGIIFGASNSPEAKTIFRVPLCIRRRRRKYTLGPAPRLPRAIFGFWATNISNVIVTAVRGCFILPFSFSMVAPDVVRPVLHTFIIHTTYAYLFEEIGETVCKLPSGERNTTYTHPDALFRGSGTRRQETYKVHCLVIIGRRFTHTLRKTASSDPPGGLRRLRGPQHDSRCFLLRCVRQTLNPN